MNTQTRTEAQNLANFYGMAVRLNLTLGMKANLAVAAAYAAVNKPSEATKRQIGQAMDKAIIAATLSNTCPSWLRNALVHQAARCAGLGLLSL